MSKSRYESIRAELEARINSGELAPGTKLPTEVELQSSHGVSRSVAQRALNELVQAGLVVRRQGLGTHVLKGARQMDLMRSVDPRLGSTGLPGEFTVISSGVVTAKKAGLVLPGVNADDPVIRLVRVKRDSDATPAVVLVEAVPFAVAPRLLDEDLGTLTIRAYFSKIGIEIARSRMYIDPVLLDAFEASLLEASPGTAVLRRRRFMWRPNGQIAQFGSYHLRPNAAEFYIEYSVAPTPHHTDT